MTDVQFKALRQLNNPLIIKEIARLQNIDEKSAIEVFYTSKLYEKYIDEATKIWHFSPVLMSELLKEELETGEIEYPVEG